MKGSVKRVYYTSNILYWKYGNTKTMGKCRWKPGIYYWEKDEKLGKKRERLQKENKFKHSLTYIGSFL